ncbi:hypothetical protein GLP24_18095 [Photobacterium carnosum]|uniref:hypothetical protein n=1 Tax=Photobacterium carnosum TaxID=2023717 RepID=UPI001E4D8AF1|nr:hypothetical protein [Photobacterium carnosum]MCD9546749.1 hypothetical protein [Photobacterium carnosum]
MLPLSFILLLFVIYDGSINKRAIRIWFLFTFFSLLIALPSFYNIYPHKNNFGYTFDSYFFGILFKSTCTVCVLLSFKGDKKRMLQLINILLIINVSFFFVQFFTVYLTSYYIDPLYFFTGERQRYFSNFSLPILGVIYRPTGLYEEPSTYSAFILLLIASKIYLDKSIDVLLKVSLGSIILSFSVASIIYGMLFAFLLFLKSKGTYLKHILSVFLPVIVVFVIYIALSRVNSVDSATSLRNNLFIYFFEQSKLEVLFGNGMLGIIPSLSDYMSSGNLWGAGVAALNDNGLWLFLAIKIGLLGLILAVFLFFKNKKNTINRVIFILILMTKISFMYFGFIFYLFLILYYKED